MSKWFATVAALVLFSFFTPLCSALAEEPAADAPALSDEEKQKIVDEMFRSPYTEEMYFRADRLLEIASGYLEPMRRAPSVATVITAEEIEATGATTLDEALEAVPGLHVGMSAKSTLDSVYSIRGIHTSVNPQVLLLVNGIPVFQAYSSRRPFVFRMPVAAISRIEVIRGPGSAVYGADALAGVINVITKKAHEIDGAQTGIRGGSFGFADVWTNYGGVQSGWDVVASLEYQQSDGDDGRIVESDLQTILDGFFGTDASLTPGALNSRYDVVNSYVGFHRDHWALQLWGWLTDDAGAGTGVTQVLAPESNINESLLLADLTYRTDELAPDLDLSLRTSYLYIYDDPLVEAFPPGALLPIEPDGNIAIPPTPTSGFVLFPDGVYGKPIKIDHHIIIEATTLYSGFSDHQLRFSTGFSFIAAEFDEYKNFGPGAIDGTVPVVSGDLVHTDGPSEIFCEDQTRKIGFVALQDEWSFGHAWELTAGLRYDRYSDFGDTFNPRVALVWEPRFDLTTKLLYGRAFRPPSFSELYAKNNPSNQGNPDLAPETSDTLELVFDFQPRSNLRMQLNLFGYRVDGLIDLVPDAQGGTWTTQNAWDQEGYGFEVEAEWQVTTGLRLRGDYSRQRSEDEETGEPVPDAPGKAVHINLDWTFAGDWSVDVEYFWVGDRKRATDDTRPEIDDYSLVNLVVRRKNLVGGLDFAAAVKNLFDEDVREPGPSTVAGDYPMPGLSLWAELRYTF